jgi:hypothetical protein
LMPRRLSASCRQFRRLHAEYIDGLLSTEGERACQSHLEICRVCAQQDVRMRRSLLALQALPLIEPSAGFRDRLHARLAHEPEGLEPETFRGVRWGLAGALLAASVALLMVVPSHPRSLAPIRLVPVMARAPERVAPLPAREVPALVGELAERSARFEALPGQAPLRSAPSMLRAPALRLQTVSFPGQ